MGPRAGLDRCGKSRPHRDSIPIPTRSQSLYRLSYPAHWNYHHTLCEFSKEHRSQAPFDFVIETGAPN